MRMEGRVMKMLETIWVFMVGLVIPIAIMLYYVDIGWNLLSTNGETTTMRPGTTDPIHQVVPQSPAVDAALSEMSETIGWVIRGRQVEADR
jgi:hypothetical protein